MSDHNYQVKRRKHKMLRDSGMDHDDLKKTLGGQSYNRQKGLQQTMNFYYNNHGGMLWEKLTRVAAHYCKTGG